MARATCKLPLSIAQYKGEMLCVPTVMFKSCEERLPRGAIAIAFFRAIASSVVTAFMTSVEPGKGGRIGGA